MKLIKDYRAMKYVTFNNEPRDKKKTGVSEKAVTDPASWIKRVALPARRDVMFEMTDEGIYKKTDLKNPEKGETYEGIWACASLLHLQKDELLPVMKVLSQTLIPGGAFYVSFKYGTFEGERNGRHFTDFTIEEFREFIKSIPELSVAEYWITGDVRPGRGDERWLNIVLQRTMICK